MTGEPVDEEPSKRQWVGYWCMIVQQTQNAFNDKMAQFILIPLAGAVGFLVPIWPGVGIGLETAAALMISLPFVLFAPIAGWMSDRFSKRHVMIGAALAQLCILAWISLSVWMGNMWMALFGFFGLAIQSAFFSPAKIGLNKELVGSRHLGFATNIQQMTAMLAILAGQIVAGIWYDNRWEKLGETQETAWDAGLLPLVILFCTALPAVVLAWIIPKVPAQGNVRFSRRLAVSHFINLKDLWSHEGLRRAACGIAFFWGIAAFINLWSIKLAKHMTEGGPGFGSLSSGFMASASLGMALGFGVAAYLLRKRIELGWVPVGGVLMALMSVTFLVLPSGGWAFMIALAILAFAAALFLAPLNAWIQDAYPAHKRGEFQSAVNLLNCLAGIVALVVIEAILLAGKWLGVSPGLVLRLEMVVCGLVCAAATWSIIRLLPGDLLRLVMLSLLRVFSSRVRAVNPEHLPQSGGVLLLPNHVTFMDAFIIAEASPRPLRFVMDEQFAGTRSIGWFTRIFGTVLIRRDQPLEAIRRIIKALKAGEVVCYFPEGQLTRTGCRSSLQRGFELIATKAGHPVVPVWMDGIWRSIASYERNRYFWKLPHRGKLQVSVAFAQAMEPKEVNKERVADALMKASAEAMASRFNDPKWGERMLQDNGILAEDFDALDEQSRRVAWANGHQIYMTNALQPQEKIHIWREDPLLHELHGLLVGFARFAHSQVIIEDRIEVHGGQVWVGGGKTSEVIENFVRGVEFRFYDFSADALEPLPDEAIEHYPCLAVEGRVIALSMPTPERQPDGFEEQLGSKPGSYGRLLPGWWVEDGRVFGPAAGEEGLPLPAGCELDEEGFVCRGKDRRSDEQSELV